MDVKIPSMLSGSRRMERALVLLATLSCGSLAFARQSSADAAAPPSTVSSAQPATPSTASTTPTKQTPAEKNRKGKSVYTGPTTIVVLPATPMLDGEGKQRVDPDGNPIFNPPVQQIRDKKGHPVFDEAGKPVFQTPTNLGYTEKGRKITAKKVKPPKMTPLSISSATLTVDGWTGKARLNYDIADFKFLYIYAPGIGTTIISQNPFPAAKEQSGAFNDKTLRITVDGHPIELASEKRLLGKKPQAAWVAVDRGFLLPAKFPVFGYGTTIKSPYAWPGSKQTVEAKGEALAPELPADLKPTLLLAPCPVGMMRRPGPVVLPGQKAPEQPCVPIQTLTPVAPAIVPATPPARTEAPTAQPSAAPPAK